MPVQKIKSNEVERGMYVASLDRPWSETPFLFQGFEVQSEHDIEELTRLTNYVYVMVPDEVINISRTPTPHASPLANSDKLFRQTYRQHSLGKEEQHSIRASHEKVVNLIFEIEKLVKKESRLTLSDVREPVEIMVESVIKSPDTYLWLTRIKQFDSFIYKDALSASVWATALGRQMGMTKEDLNTLATGCMMLDVGKMKIPPAILNKQDRLNDQEWELLKSHVQLGLDVLADDPTCSQDVLEMVRTHHERIDGSGYPGGLKGMQIPLFGQIAGIVDFYTSVTTARPFAKVLSPSHAEQLLYEQKDVYFDGLLVDYFIQTLSTYPTGSLVELSSGEVAIVYAQNASLRLKPDVVLLLDEDKHPYSSYPLQRLSNYEKDGMAVSIRRALKDGEYGLNVEEMKF